MKSYLIRICAFTVALLLSFQPIVAAATDSISEVYENINETFNGNNEESAVDKSHDNEPDKPSAALPMSAEGVQRAATDIECWMLAPSIQKNYDALVLETPTGVNCLPETVPAKLFEVKRYVAEGNSYEGEIINAEYMVDYVAYDKGNIPGNEFDFIAPDMYTIYATIIIPQGYIKSTKYKSTMSFYFIVTVTAPEPDWSFFNYKISDAYVDADSSPSEWALKNSVACLLWDRNFSQPDIELGLMPIIWDLDNIAIEKPGIDENGEYEATVPGVIKIPDNIDITGVAGISENHTVPVENYIVARKKEAFFGFSKPTKYITNPEFKDAGNNPYVSFAVNFIEKSWGDDFSIWLTDDDGKTFTDINGSKNVVIYAGGKHESVVSYVDLYKLEYNKWYGICLELQGNYPYTGTTKTIYFMFNEGDVYSEPSGGDRNGDGRWPFISPGNDEQLTTGNNVPENNTNNTNNNGNTNGNNNGNNSGVNTTNQSEDDSYPLNNSSSGGSRTETQPFSFGGNTGSVTGKRLDALMTVYPHNVPFINNGSKLQIPTEFINSLGISQSGTINVSISKVYKNSFSIQLKVNNKITTYSGKKLYTAYIPYTQANSTEIENLLIVDSDGNIQPISYYDSRGYFVLKTNQFGDFTIKEGKPSSFSDFKSGYLDFLSVRGIVTGTSGQKFNPSNMAKQNELYIMLENLSGGIGYAERKIYPQTALTYSSAVGLLEKYAEQIGVQVDREELLSLLPISEYAVLSRNGCAKLIAEFIKKL